MLDFLENWSPMTGQFHPAGQTDGNAMMIALASLAFPHCGTDVRFEEI
jgi:hypothetical protein